MGKYFERPATKKFGVNKSSGSIQKRSFGNSYGGGGGGGRGGPMMKKSKFSMTDEDLPIPDWESVTLKPFKKDFYVPHENIARR